MNRNAQQNNQSSDSCSPIAKNHHDKSHDQDAAQILRSNDMSATRPRIALLEHILENHPFHFSPEQIHQDISKKNISIARASVYNILAELAAKGIIRQTQYIDQRCMYDSNTIPHAHLVDQQTGEIMDFDMDQLVLPAELRERYNIDSVEITVRASPK